MSEALAYLIRIDKNEQERVILDQDVIFIGKKKGQVDVAIEDEPTVSRIHAQVFQQDGRFYIRDLDSSNGTYVNGERVQKSQVVALKDMDEINFACARYTFLEPDREDPGTVPGKQTTCTVCYSPVGGAGSTSFGMAAANILTANGRKTLFISTDAIQSFHFDLGGSPFMDEELIGALTSDRTDFWSCVLNNIEHRNFDFLRPTRQPGCNYSLDASAYQRLIRMLQAVGIYEELVIDLGSEMTGSKQELLNGCDRVLVPVIMNERELNKVYRFLSSFDYRKEERYTYFCNRYHGSDRETALLKQLQQYVPVRAFVMEEAWTSENFMTVLMQNQAFVEMILKQS